MATDSSTLQSLVQETAPLVQAVNIMRTLCLTDARAYFELSSGWTCGPAASTTPVTNMQQKLDQLIDQIFPAPPADALPPDQVVQLFIATADGSGGNLLSALGELGKLSWPDRFHVLEQLRSQGPSQAGQTYLEIIEATVATLPNVDQALYAAMIVVLMEHGGRTLSAIDITVTLMQALVVLDERDQWSLLSKLGLHGTAIEGTMASLTGQAIAVGLLQVPAELLNILAASQATTPIGEFKKPGNQPGGLYIGLAAHEAIALEYRLANQPPLHLVFTNTSPVDMILAQLQGLLMFKGNKVATALALSKPDIFDFSFHHTTGAPGWVYEIKPWNSLATAEYEALFYCAALGKAGLDSTPGPIGAPGTSGCLPAPGGWYVFTALAPGAIVYWYRKATKAELQARGMAPADDKVEQQTLAALNAAGATAAVVGTAAALAALLAALQEAGWALLFLAA